jgi:phospholipase/lecithinase/hemolysin
MLFNHRLGRLASRAVAGLAVVAALASCGGGTYQVSAFVPARILTFGDESSMLVGPQGLKYSINGVSTETQLIDCSLLPMWTQVLAASYNDPNLVYANCNREAVPNPNAVQLATIDATVDDLETQVATFRTGDTFNNNDLVTVWVGMHDVLQAYAENGSNDDVNALTTDMRARGIHLANIVNSIAGSGARVILLTIPDMGLSPYAAAENQRGDFDRAALLTQMSDAFNRSLRSNVINDGSKIGLVLPDDYVKAAVRNPSGFGYIAQPNVTPGCTNISPLPGCRQDELITDISVNSNQEQFFLWADSTHLGAAPQQNIGNQAVSRAHSNPF